VVHLRHLGSPQILLGSHGGLNSLWLLVPQSRVKRATWMSLGAQQEMLRGQIGPKGNLRVMGAIRRS
jgi:hypothetical protein